MNPRPLNMGRVTSRGIYCVRPDLVQGIVEMPINGFMVPHPDTQVTSDVLLMNRDPYTQGIVEMLIMNRDRITAHAHRTSPNTPIAMGIRDRVLVRWSTALGWWFASYGEAVIKAQSLGSVVYTS